MQVIRRRIMTLGLLSGVALASQGTWAAEGAGAASGPMVAPAAPGGTGGVVVKPASPLPAAVGRIIGHIRAAQGGAIKQAVVYLDGVPAGSFTVPMAHVLISQRGARFRPEFAVVVAGQTVDMPNDDRIVHNVFSVSPARKFDLGHYGQGEYRSVQFPKPGVVEMFCNIHENMQATLVVVPSTYYAQPAADGSFAIANVPEGTYQLVGYSPQAGDARVAVTVRAQQDSSHNLDLQVRKAAP